MTTNFQLTTLAELFRRRTSHDRREPIVRLAPRRQDFWRATRTEQFLWNTNTSWFDVAVAMTGLMVVAVQGAIGWTAEPRARYYAMGLDAAGKPVGASD